MTADTREEFGVETVLVPIDGSEESTTAVDYAIAVADRYDASLYVLYVLGRGVVQGMDAGTVEMDSIADHTQEVLEDVRELASERDVSSSTAIVHGFSKTIKTRHPGSVVLDTAESVDADFLVVPRESVAEPGADVLEKTAEYVLAYASQPVLSV